MVKVSTEILEIIKRYIELLDMNGFPVSNAYLLGSYSNGNENEWSDIDIAIVSEKFDGNRFMDKEKIRGFYRQVDSRISVYPLNKSSLSGLFVQSEIINKGIKVY